MIPPAYSTGMARPKRFIDKTMVRFPANTFEEIDLVLTPGEDRADLVRRAVDREISFRRAGLHTDVQPFLMKGEDELEFFNNAIRRALEARRAMLATEKQERGLIVQPDRNSSK